MKRRTAIPVAVAIAIAATSLRAQTWRTFDVSRQARDTQPLAVHLRYTAGRVRVQPSADNSLYGLHLRFDAQSVDPVYRFNDAARTLDIGVEHPNRRKNFRDEEGSDLQLHLARTVPMRLQLDVGAAEGDIDLTGIPVEELSLQTGAADTHVRFTAPNPRHLSRVYLQAGAANVEVVGLGHANTSRVDLNLGVGNATLDFAGEWQNDIEMTVNSAIGKVTLRVPADVGVSIESTAFLHSAGGADMVKRGGQTVSTNWDTAKHKLRVTSSGAFGRLEVTRIGN